MEMKVFKKISTIKGNVFVDVGACQGMYALRLAKNFTEVVAIEPDKRNIRTLTTLVKALRRKNVAVSDYAVSNRTGFVRLFTSDDVHHGTIKEELVTQRHLQHTLVKSTKLDDLIKKPIDLIKVDVQGAVFDLLGGAGSIMGDTKRWLIELDGEEFEKKQDLEKLMKSFGYSVSWVSPRHLYSTKAAN